MHCRSLERVLRCGSIKDCASPLLDIKHHIKSWNNGVVPTSWMYGKVLHYESIEECIDPLLGIKH